MPIDAMNKDNGGLWIDKNNYPEDQGMEEDLDWIDAGPGDLLFMHPHLFHGSGPNMNPTKGRKTLLTGYCAYGANSKPYPGANVSMKVTRGEDGEIVVEPAPWKDGVQDPANKSGIKMH